MIFHEWIRNSSNTHMIFHDLFRYFWSSYVLFTLYMNETMFVNEKIILIAYMIKNLSQGNEEVRECPRTEKQSG